jgi:PAS domain S-box-containing protein
VSSPLQPTGPGSPRTPAALADGDAGLVESHFRAIVESSEDAILTKDLDGTINSWNPAAEALYGWRADEAIGRSIEIVMVDPREAARILGALREGRRTEPYDTVRRRRDGSLVDVAVSISPVRDRTGTVIGGAAIARDISGRKRGEEAVRRSELRYRTLVSQLLDAAVFEYDDEFRIIKAEGPLLDRMTPGRRDVVGRTLWDLLPPDDADRFAQHYSAALLGEARQFAWTAPEGESFDVDVVPSRDEAGRIVGAMALTRDVTERRRIERDLDFQAQLLDRLEVAVVATDLAGRVTHWNRQAEVYYDRPRAEAIGSDLADLNAAYAIPEPSATLAELLRGRTTHSEWDISRADGSVMPVLTMGSAIHDALGEPIGFVGVGMDMTATRAAQADKAALEARLHRAEKLDAIGRLAGGIAHDFNNLLAVILNYTDFAMDAAGAEPRGIGDDLREVRRAAERAAALTRQLLVFGRREIVQPQPLDVGDIVRGTETLLARTIGEDIELEIRVGAVWLARADRSQMEQVILNLALNARDAMPGGGRLCIAAENIALAAPEGRRTGLAPGDYVRLTVTDTGSGMPAEVVEQAFEPFFTTKPVGAGTGLGLPTVYGIVRGAGGHVDLRSEPGHGTCVAIWLPAAADSAVASQPEPDRASAAGAGETILVVEDARAVRTLAARILRDAGYAVVEADDPADAISLAAQPDLVLTDVVMPGMSGGDLARVLRERRPDLPVVFMSGYTDDVVMRHGVLERRVAFVEKPFTRDSLLAAVRQGLEAVPRDG